MTTPQTALIPSNTSTLPALRLPVTEAVKELLSASKRPNTLAAYRFDWASFETWCSCESLQSLPASPETLAEYIAAKRSELQPSTLQRHCASIAQAHRLAGYQSPTESELVRTALQGLRALSVTAYKAPKKGRKSKAPALTAEAMRETLSRLPADGAGVRDRALLLVGYKTAARRSELSALQWWQVEWQAEGVLLKFQASKTDKTYTGQQVALVREGGLYCPVSALEAWREWCLGAGIDSQKLETGAVFRGITKHLKIAEKLSAHAIGEIVKARTIGAGLAGITAHSLRRGHLTEGIKQGKTEADLMRTSRHRSVAVFRSYVEEADPFKRATGKGLL